MGTVVWQLNDCWPVTSWAVIDGDGRLKPLWFALRRVYDPQLVTVQPRSHRLHVFMVNDRAAAWTSEVNVRRHHVDGAVLAQWTTRLTAEAGSRTDIELPAEVTTPSDPRRELLVVTAGTAPPPGSSPRTKTSATPHLPTTWRSPPTVTRTPSASPHVPFFAT